MACTNCGATWDQCPACRGNTPPDRGPGGLSHMPSTADREWIKEKQCPPDSQRVHIPAINGTAGIPANTFALYEQAEGGEYRRTKILTGHQ